MTMNFPGLTGRAGGAASKQSSNYAAGPGGQKKGRAAGLRGVETGPKWLACPGGGDKSAERGQLVQEGAVEGEAECLSRAVRIVANTWCVEPCR